MAITKILPVRGQLKGCLDYAANPQKTEYFSTADMQRLIGYMHISVQERRLYGVLATLSRSKATQPYIQEPKFHLHEQIGPPCRNV